MASLPKLKLENNLYRFYDDFIGFEDFIVKKDENYNFISSGKYQWPGYVYNIKANHENCDQLIHELEKKILSKEIPPFLLVDPKRVHDNFEEKINQIEIKKIDFWPIIFMDLKTENLQLHNISDYVVLKANNEKQFQEWYDIVIAVLFPKKSIPYGFFQNRMNDNRYSFYVGYYKNLPVATAMVFTDNKVAGFYMVATNNEFRKRGFGKGIVMRTICDTKESGCSHITAQSSRMAFPVYQQIGFQHINTLDVYWMLGKGY
jgi:hypothetical protein